MPRPAQPLSREIASFLDAHRALVWFVIAAASLAYGLAVVNVSLSIDEEVHLLFDHSRVWTLQGRFGTTLLKLLLGSTYPIPYFQPAVAIAVLASSALIWCLVFVRVTAGRLERSAWLTVFAVAFVTMPTNAYYLSFNTYNLEVSAGYALTALAVLAAFEFLDKRRWSAYAAATLSAFLAIAIYQSFVLQAAAGIGVAYLLRAWSAPAEETPAARRALGELAALLGPILVGFLAYVFVNRQLVTNGAYVESFLNWGRLEPSFLVPWLTWHVETFYAGTYFVGGGIVPVLGIVGLGVLARIALRGVNGRRFLPAVIWSLVLASPVVLSLALGTHMPNRTQQALPVAFGAIPLMAAALWGAARRLRNVATVVAVALLLANAQATSRLLFAEQLSFRDDMARGRRIAGELVDLGWGGDATPIVVSGTPSMPPTIYSIQSETIGVSFFEHGSGERASYFMKFLGHPFRPPTRAERERALALADAMPDWPRKGSVAWVDGIAVVRFGPPTEFQRQLISR